MTPLDDIPLWAALVIAALVVLGSTLALIGALGLIRLKSFYERLHAPSLGGSWATGAIVLASIVQFSLLAGKLVLHEMIIGIFIMVTTPVATILLGRAALHRDMADGLIEGPAPAVVPDPPPAPATDTVPGDDPLP